MKLILLILLLSPCFLKAQVDTVGVISSVSAAGTFYLDTIKVQNNTSQYFLLSLKGGAAKAVKFISISNTKGVYKIVSNTNPIVFSGLTGGKFEVAVVNNLVMVKITGTKDIISWELKRINL